MKTLAVIPARLSSSRIPRKVLAMLGPYPMVEWVFRAAEECADLDEVVVATDSESVAECVAGFGGRVEMTRPDHRSGTDRVAEVAARRSGFDVVVNVQADQPFVKPAMLSELLGPFQTRGERPAMTSLACELDPERFVEPGTVKVVCDRFGNALYFSRAPVPYAGGRAPPCALHHLGLYAFTTEFLALFATLPPGPLENAESLEQLRALEHGHSIRICIVDEPVLEVNTPRDMVRARDAAASRS